MEIHVAFKEVILTIMLSKYSYTPISRLSTFHVHFANWATSLLLLRGTKAA